MLAFFCWVGFFSAVAVPTDKAASNLDASDFGHHNAWVNAQQDLAALQEIFTVNRDVMKTKVKDLEEAYEKNQKAFMVLLTNVLAELRVPALYTEEILKDKKRFISDYGKQLRLQFDDDKTIKKQKVVKLSLTEDMVIQLLRPQGKRLAQEEMKPFPDVASKVMAVEAVPLEGEIALDNIRHDYKNYVMSLINEMLKNRSIQVISGSAQGLLRPEFFRRNGTLNSRKVRLHEISAEDASKKVWAVEINKKEVPDASDLLKEDKTSARSLAMKNFKRFSSEQKNKKDVKENWKPFLIIKEIGADKKNKIVGNDEEKAIFTIGQDPVTFYISGVDAQKIYGKKEGDVWLPQFSFDEKIIVFKGSRKKPYTISVIQAPKGTSLYSYFQDFSLNKDIPAVMEALGRSLACFHQATNIVNLIKNKVKMPELQWGVELPKKIPSEYFFYSYMHGDLRFANIYFDEKIIKGTFLIIDCANMALSSNQGKYLNLIDYNMPLSAASEKVFYGKRLRSILGDITHFIDVEGLKLPREEFKVYEVEFLKGYQAFLKGYVESYPKEVRKDLKELIKKELKAKKLLDEKDIKHKERSLYHRVIMSRKIKRLAELLKEL